MNDIERKRAERALQTLGDALLETLGGITTEELASSPDDLRDALVAAIERNVGYVALGRLHASQDEAEGIPGDRCENRVCPSWADDTRWVDQGDGTTRPTGGNGACCTNGVDGAQSCMYRMTEAPPVMIERKPSHAEALRMLVRAGLMPPDDFGHWNGTDFAQRRATRRLWWAFVDCLVKLHEIPRAVLPDRGAESEAALDWLGYPGHGDYSWGARGQRVSISNWILTEFFDRMGHDIPCIARALSGTTHIPVERIIDILNCRGRMPSRQEIAALTSA